jgi:hypothetical protein
MSHYAGVESSLSSGQSAQAIQIMEAAKDEYGNKSRLLFLMDHGMVLHLAGQYTESNAVLEEAHLLIEDLYTKRLRDEAAALLVNEARQPYEGAPHEHVMVNVVKGLNYAFLQQWSEALVEARRIDHRLNVLSDKVEEKNTYHEDPFARYLVGLLYDIAGDINNAYVGYRKAEQVYEDGQAWIRVPLPDVLKSDLIRTANRLGLYEDVEQYQEKYPEVAAQPVWRTYYNLPQIVVIAYHGQGPKKEDLVIDVPVSRIALPRFTIPKKSSTLDTVQFRNEKTTINTQTQLMYDVQAVAEKTLADEYDSLVLRAVARTSMKMAAAEGIGYGARAASGKNNRDWIGPLVGGIARIFALATEEADIRTWRTLPGEIQLTRLWVEPGEYSMTIQSMDLQGQGTRASQNTRLQLKEDETLFLFHQSLH